MSWYINLEVALGEYYNKTAEVYALAHLRYKLLTLKRQHRTIDDMGNNNKKKNGIG